MKKAIVDQILLGLFIFVVLIVVGATINDNTQARDKFYTLKKYTDNAVLTLAKCYINIGPDIDNCVSIYENMLPLTNLGNEINQIINDLDKYQSFTQIIDSDNNIVAPNGYNDSNTSSFFRLLFDLSGELLEVKANVPSYIEETFWFKLLGLASLNLKVESVATITYDNHETESTSNFSYGIAPFAINENADFDQLFADNTPLNFQYKAVSDWDYNDKTSFYPIVPTSLINCGCPYILSDQYDWSNLNFDFSLCSTSNTECSTDGESEFQHYTSEISNIYNAKTSIDFENDNVSSIISLLGTYLGDSTSTWATQMNHLSSGLYDLVDGNIGNLPIQLDIITLDNQGKASGVVRIQVNGFDFETTGKPTNQYIILESTVIGKEIKVVKLTH